MKFPGIGRRQAKRFVYFLLHKDESFKRGLSKTILELGDHVDQCIMCFKYFPKNGNDRCSVCIDPARDHRKLLILEKDSDLEVLHATGLYGGLYFILGELIPITNKVGEKKPERLKKLLDRIKKDIGSGTLKEVIIGFSLNPEGEHTRIFLQTEIEKINTGKVSVSILGRGLSTGTELEYSDSETLKNALETRIEQ